MGRDKSDGQAGAKAKPALRATQNFVDVVAGYLTELDWTQQDLADHAGISRPQMSGWLGKRDRTLGPDDVDHIAWSIAGGFDDAFERNPKTERFGIQQHGRGRSVLRHILHRLHEAAGYTLGTGREGNLVWNRLAGESLTQSKRVLRVGKLPWGDFTRGNDSLVGEILQRLGSLLGVEIEPVETELPAFRDQIREAEVDLIFPLFILPARLFDIEFSESIPGIGVGIEGLVHKGHREGLVSGGRIAENKVKPVFGRGAVSESLCAIFAPGSLGIAESHVSQDEALKSVLAHPTDKERVRVFIADQVTCGWLAQKPEFADSELLSANADRGARLPVAFGLHLQEPILKRAVDMSIRIMERQGFFRELYRRHEASFAGCEGILAADDADLASRPEKPPSVHEPKRKPRSLTLK